MEKTILNPVFALVSEGHIVKEGISEQELFGIVEKFYEPEFNNFEIQVWDTTLNTPMWVTI